jgi:hypothetical protein
VGGFHARGLLVTANHFPDEAVGHRMTERAPASFWKWFAAACAQLYNFHKQETDVLRMPK